MAHTLTAVRVVPLAHHSAQVAADIHAVLLPAYAQEAALLKVQHFPLLLRSAADVRDNGDVFLGALVAAVGGETLAGVLSMAPDDEPGQTTVTMLVVHPAQQRRGLGRRLLHEAIHRAGSQPLSVSTAAANTPALALYAGLGFTVYRHGTIGPESLPLVKLRRMPGAAHTDLAALGISPPMPAQLGLPGHSDSPYHPRGKAADNSQVP